MGRPLNIPWQQDVRELFRLYTTEEDPMIERRVKALWLLRLGKDFDEVAEIVEVHYRTVQQWVAWYRQGGLDEVRSHSLAGPGQSSRLTEEQTEALRDELARGNLGSAEEVARWVYEVFGVEYSMSGTYALLRRLQGTGRGRRPGRWHLLLRKGFMAWFRVPRISGVLCLLRNQ